MKIDKTDIKVESILNYIKNLYPNIDETEAEIKAALNIIIHEYLKRDFQKYKSLFSGRIVYVGRSLKSRLKGSIISKLGLLMEDYINIYRDWLNLVNHLTEEIYLIDHK